MVSIWLSAVTVDALLSVTGTVLSSGKRKAGINRARWGARHFSMTNTEKNHGYSIQLENYSGLLPRYNTGQIFWSKVEIIDRLQRIVRSSCDGHHSFGIGKSDLHVFWTGMSSNAYSSTSTSVWEPLRSTSELEGRARRLSTRLSSFETPVILPFSLIHRYASRPLRRRVVPLPPTLIINSRLYLSLELGDRVRPYVSISAGDVIVDIRSNVLQHTIAAQVRIPSSLFHQYRSLLRNSFPPHWFYTPNTVYDVEPNMGPRHVSSLQSYRYGIDPSF